jgi:hypothetical protein
VHILFSTEFFNFMVSKFSKTFLEPSNLLQHLKLLPA